MSILVMSMVYATKLGNANRKAVALKLADYARDDGGRVYPSLARISEETEVSKSTVQRSVRELLKMGILSVVKRGGAGPKATTEYKFNMDRLAKLEKVVTVTTLEPAKVVTDDKKGSHGDHRSIREPLEIKQDQIISPTTRQQIELMGVDPDGVIDRIKRSKAPIKNLNAYALAAAKREASERLGVSEAVVARMASSDMKTRARAMVAAVAASTSPKPHTAKPSAALLASLGRAA
jgi:DNA-binding transcriptional MocR family regulator